MQTNMRLDKDSRMLLFMLLWVMTLCWLNCGDWEWPRLKVEIYWTASSAAQGKRKLRDVMGKCNTQEAVHPWLDLCWLCSMLSCTFTVESEWNPQIFNIETCCKGGGAYCQKHEELCLRVPLVFTALWVKTVKLSKEVWLYLPSLEYAH